MTASCNTHLSEFSDLNDETIPIASRWLGSWHFSLRRRALSNAELVNGYNQYAGRWNQMLARLDYPDSYENLLRTLVDNSMSNSDPSPLRVLDSGIGTGELSLALARSTQHPLVFDAIDISPCMLAQAHTRLSGSGLDISLRQGDARQLPYSDGVFDLTMSAHLLEHFSTPHTALAEMVRVTKPGGLVMVCLSKRSLLGRYIQLKWRTHLVSPAQAEFWLRESSLEGVHCLSSGTKGAFRQLSIACMGRKPVHAENSGVTNENNR